MPGRATSAKEGLMQLPELEAMARRVRGELVAMSHRARTPHLGSSLSCVELMLACYGRAMRFDPSRMEAPDRDRFILSKGHAATTLYAVLAELGVIPRELLRGYAEPGSPLAEHPSAGCVAGVELATGSLGHGLSVGLGMALAARIRGCQGRVHVLLSDGECNEGSVWEAALFGAAQRLGNLVALVDYNKWQATGRSDEVLGLAPLGAKWEAFGWAVSEVDGHDLGAIAARLEEAKGSDRPSLIVGHTVKGKGVSFMEDDNNWHYRIPTAQELAAARRELGLEAQA